MLTTLNICLFIFKNLVNTQSFIKRYVCKHCFQQTKTKKMKPQILKVYFSYTGKKYEFRTFYCSLITLN